MTMEKNVKGATKVKLAAPKSKYIEPILAATRGGESGIADIFRTLQLRLRDTTWTIVFKALIVVHLMIKQGASEVTLRFLAESPKRMAISSFTEGQTQGVGIRRYYEYLLTRVRVYRDVKVDHVKSGSGTLKGLTVDKGLLRQTELVQDQIKALLKCDLLGGQDPENEISITAFRLLTLDLFELFAVMNQGTINVLEHYFEMSKPDAERALSIYQAFVRQTEQVVQYLTTAREYELYTKLEVPKLKHAPTTLTSSLQDYINDPDFEINRRQYLAQQEAKRSGKGTSQAQTGTTPFDKPSVASSTSNVASAKPKTAAPTSGPAPDLIDFFESIDLNQQTMTHQPDHSHQSQFNPNFMAQAQFAPQQLQQPTGYNPFLPQVQNQQPQPLQPDFTGAGFGGYGPQPPQQASAYAFSTGLSTIPQEGVPDFNSQQQTGYAMADQAPQPLQPQQTSTNPFRQSMMPSAPQQYNNVALNRQSTNPFAKHNNGFTEYGQSLSPVYSPQASQAPGQEQVSTPSPQPLQAQQTGTNPFAKPRPTGPTSSLAVNVTGSTNPFRQSQFVNQATGQGWQHGAQGTFGGFDMNQVNTNPVFPRPGQS